jgi:hypothetical protein
MTKAKPFPYKAAFLIDEAIMDASVAGRTIEPLMDKTDLETVARAGKAANLINRIILKLQEARSLRPEDSNG